jgi:ElaB/YqjD/DUF883 family membrane-anchored ribosome-binding protein
MSTFDKDNTLRDDFRKTKGDAERLASNAYAQARDVADETVERVKMEGEAWVDTVSDYVANRPLTSIGIAAAIGYVVAKLRIL